MFSWDMEEVSHEIDRCEKLMRKEKDVDKKEEIQSTIYSFEELEDYYYSVAEATGGKVSSKYYSIQEACDFREIRDDDLNILRRYGEYCQIVRDFTSLYRFQDIKTVKELGRTNTNPKDIVSLSTNFYQQFTGVFYDTYQELAKDFRSRLLFLKAKSLYDYTGNTHPILGTSRVYIDVTRVNSTQDYVSHIHESSHGITCLLNKDIMWDFNKYCFTEVDSLFFEIIGTDYVGAKLGKEDEANRIKLATFRDYLYNAEILCSKMDLYNTLSPRELKDKRNIRAFFKKKVGYDKQGVSDACSTFIHDYLHYIVSYLTAIELFLIYRVDKDIALDLLYKIIMLKDLSTADYLKSIKDMGIVPGKNIKTYYDMVVPNEMRVSYGKRF